MIVSGRRAENGWIIRAAVRPRRAGRLRQPTGAEERRMRTNHRTAFAIVLISPLCFALQPFGQSGDKPTLAEQRKRLADVHRGMSAEQVLKKLGKPDEMRRVPNSGILDGVGYGTNGAPEVERWAYGTLGKGMFARVGFVSLDRNGQVLIARSPDVFSDRAERLFERVLPKDEQAVPTPSKMSCQVGHVQYIPFETVTLKGPIGTFTAPEGVKMTVTLKNAGPTAFELKHGAATGVVVLLLVELYDAGGVLLFRENYLRYLSTYSFDPAKWPVLSVPAGRERSEEFVFRPDEAFGPLPAGKYSLRVYFPFEEKKYYPSNLVSFEWKGRGKK